MTEYTGYESAFVPTESYSSDDQKIERKTEKSQKNNNQSKQDADKKEIFLNASKKNILSNYRSYTYNFTLAALYKDQVNDPAKYRNSELDLVILKSGGKGTDRYTEANSGNLGLKILNAKSKEEKDQAIKEYNQQQTNNQAIAGFNNDSPGRFDMFIDDIEIETIMAFSQQGGTTQPTSIKFDVIEPYSINGFLEALQIAAVKAGYPTYATASFLLKIQFIGYPDAAQLPEPELIEKSERYFVFAFNACEVEVTERGTKYRCAGVPFTEKVYGQPGKLKKAVKMSGENVREILEDLMENMTDLEKQNAKKAYNNLLLHDEYQVSFRKNSGGSWVSDRFGKIAESKLSELGTESNLYQMIDPSQSQKKTNYKTTQDVAPSGDTIKDEKKFEPKKTVTQFPENVNAHEIIAAIIRDSQYVSNLIKKLPIDDDGMIEYFIVRTETKNKNEIDPNTKRPFQIFTYVVTPFKIHYTAIPNLESNLSSEKNLKRNVLREYNYLYTGLNTEIRNFRLNFNFLYYEAVPQDMGNKNEKGTQTAARPGNTSKVTGNSATLDTKSTVPQASKRADPSATSILPPSGYNSALPKNDPYSVLAKTMHEKVLNSVSLAQAEIEILGDPYFLVTGGIGNYEPGLSSNLETIDGEAAHNVAQVLIAINFRNPIDIGPGGLMYFDSNRIPFSGVFQVTTVKSSFKDGFFYQRLNLIRIPGQLIDTNLQPTDPKDLISTSPNENDQVKEDSIQAIDFGQRISEPTLTDQIDRGVPSPDGNFVNAQGGLGGNDPVLKNQAFGAFSIDGGLAAGSLTVGDPLPVDFSRNVRLNQQGLSDLSKYSLENASKVKETINTLFAFNYKTEVTQLAQTLITQDLSKNQMIGYPGSGIGQGATQFIDSAELSLDSNSLNYKQGLPNNLSSLNLANISNLTNKKSSNILNNVGDNLGSLLGTKADPNAIASKVRLDSSKISGLGGMFQSKVTNQIQGFKNLPTDVNLTQEVNDGLLLEYMSSGDLQNVPASQPKTIAPKPTVNEDYINKVVARGGVKGLSNLYGVSDPSKISQNNLSTYQINNVLENVNPAQFNPLKNYRTYTNNSDLQGYVDRAVSSSKQLDPISGSPYVSENQLKNSVLGIFGSKALGSSPLDKLVNKTGNIDAPVYTGNNQIIRKNLGLPPLKT